MLTGNLNNTSAESFFKGLKNYLADAAAASARLDELADKMVQDPDISDTAIQYTLKLMQEPEKTVNFEQFEAEKKEKFIIAKEFIKEFYKADNEPFRNFF